MTFEKYVLSAIKDALRTKLTDEEKIEDIETTLEIYRRIKANEESDEMEVVKNIITNKGVELKEEADMAKKYVVKFGDLSYRFDSKEEADRFYKLNRQDYMDAPEEIEIKTDVDLEDFYENGIHPYENKVDAECAKADGLEL